MDAIISKLSNCPSEQLHQRKLQLNEEFHRKAKIQGLVSYIYYPSQRECILIGHVELEIEGNSYTLISPVKNKSLPRMIKSSEAGHGFPFFRFHISVTPNQLKDIKENCFIPILPICTIGVSNTLSVYGKYTIPPPFSFLPLTSAIYLTGAKFLGSKRIDQIHFHSGKNQMKNLAKIIPGIFIESLSTLSMLSAFYSSISGYFSKGA